jgi:FMN phosphatase YigB (HAD superfamily)
VQRQEIEALGIGHFFEHVFIEGEVGEGKPHVAAFRMAEKAFGLSPDEFLMVGNSFKHDIAGAQKAGWHTAWLRKDTDLGLIRTEATLEQLPEGAQAPDIEMSDLRELLKAL